MMAFAMMACRAASPSVRAAGPGWRISDDLISCNSPRFTAGMQSKPGRWATFKRLIVGNVTFDPLDVRAELLKDFVGLGGSRTQLLALKAADLRNISFNDESS